MCKENTTIILDKTKLKAYALEQMPKKHDYSILMEGDLERIIDALVDAEEAYIQSIEPDLDDIEYDDDEAFDRLINCFMDKFPQYSTFGEAIVDDYMDASEQYLSDAGEIEWE